MERTLCTPVLLFPSRGSDECNPLDAWQFCSEQNFPITSPLEPPGFSDLGAMRPRLLEIAYNYPNLASGLICTYEEYIHEET
jgi:hypothetical protein